MDIATAILLTIACLDGPSLLIILGVLTVSYLSHRRKAQDLGQSLKREIARLKNLVQELKRDASQVSRDEWLKSVANIDYRNEIEVEVKFVYPLLRYLDHDIHALEIRVPANVQVGRQQVKGEADWVVWDETPSRGHRRALVVVEAKGPGQKLDSAVQAQVRSYAFGLSAPMYVLTNGQRIQIFRRGIERDDCVLDCEVNELVVRWGEIEEHIGASAWLGRNEV
jgi:predicted type IV restriction endonuclease